ncbi:MAG: hypothetical protein ACK452_01545 [Bacteroidota bacterium]
MNLYFQFIRYKNLTTGEIKKYSYSTLLFCFLLPIFIFPQKNPLEKNIVEGNKLLLENNYNAALSEFEKAFIVDTANAYLNYKLGICYLHHTKNKHLAESYLERSIKSISEDTEDNNPESRTAPPMAIFYYAVSLHLDYRFEESIKYFEQYRTHVPPKFKEEHDVINDNIQCCKNAMSRIENPTNLKIKDLGDSINDVYLQTSPYFESDSKTLYYTLSSPDVKGASNENITTDGKYFSDLFLSKEIGDNIWSKPNTIPGFVNTGVHENSSSLLMDKNLLIFSKGEKGKEDLYTSTWDGIEWMIPTKITGSVNTSYNEKSPFISTDGNTLFFVSNRKGGFGGYDIYRSKKLPNGNWGIPENLGPKVNTRYDEECPFPHFETNELFFSSCGHSTMGNYDIFNINLDSNKNISGDAVALAYPINTTGNDVFYTMTKDNQYAYYSSDHQSSDSYGDYDLYKIYLTSGKDSTKPEKRMVIYTGHILTNQKEEIQSKLSIHVTYKNNKELYGTYHPQRNGNFISALPPGNTFVFSYLFGGKEFLMEELEIPDLTTQFELERKDTIIPVIKVEPVVAKVDSTKNIPIKNAVLNFTVIDLKNFQPEPGAKVVIREDFNDGKVYEFYTNEKGILDSVLLPEGKYYKVTASFREFIGEEEIISTKTDKNKKISKTLYVFNSTET